MPADQILVIAQALPISTEGVARHYCGMSAMRSQAHEPTPFPLDRR